MHFKRIREDIDAFMSRDPAARGPISIIAFYPGFHALMGHRMSHHLWTRGFPFLGRLISQLFRWLTGIEIHPGAQIGRRFVIDHGAGVVIGETAVIGDDVTLYHQVTLGGTAPSVDSDEQRGQKRHPTLEDGVIVGCGAAVLGPIRVGKGARVGANAVVTKDVPPNVTAVGNPAQVILPRDKRHMGEFQAYGTPADAENPLIKALENLRAEMATMSARIRELEAHENVSGGQAADQTAPGAKKAGKKAS